MEYSQTPPPYVTADGDGTTTNRSQLWEPGDTDWSTLSLDLNIRAFVIYYGVDGVPPTINQTTQFSRYFRAVIHIAMKLAQVVKLSQ